MLTVYSNTCSKRSQSAHCSGRSTTACVEVGWAVRKELWGRGYATEIGAAGIQRADEVVGPDVIWAFTEIHNWRSRAVMERLGMTFARRITAYGLVEGRAGVHDHAPFALYVLPRRRATARQ